MAGRKAPHLVQYQGSKRSIAPMILEYTPVVEGRFVEPFCGVCAMSIAMAMEGRAQRYWLNDINEPLVRMMRLAIEQPDTLADNYAEIWVKQFEGDHVAHFWSEREKFNNGGKTEARMLYLIARCVKGAIRYGSDGQMNQSPDKRRHGTKPETIRKNAHEISYLLRGKCEFTSLDYREVFAQAHKDDLLYMDPPYQGTSFVSDHRYYQGVARDELVDALADLNRNGVGFLLSYDGQCGEKAYGRDLPANLECEKVMIDAGRSSQATLLGREERTLEALYISPIAKRATS